MRWSELIVLSLASLGCTSTGSDTFAAQEVEGQAVDPTETNTTGAAGSGGEAGSGAGRRYAGELPWPACPGQQQLDGHVIPPLIDAPLVGPMPEDGLMQVSIGLPVRNPGQLDAEVSQVSDPSSPYYRQYLTTEEFTDAYGPTDSDYQRLIAWAEGKGLRLVQTFSNHLLFIAEGTVGAVERAFCIRLNYYLRSDGTQCFGPDREPSLDVDVPVLAISGLDNYCVPTSVSFGPPPLEGCDF